MPSKRVIALSVAEAGPTTSPAPEGVVQFNIPVPSVYKNCPALPVSIGSVKL